MQHSKLAKAILCFGILALGGCASQDPFSSRSQDEPWYQDVAPAQKNTQAGAIYDSNRHSLLLGVGSKYNVGDLIVVEVTEETNSSDSSSNKVKKENDYSHGINFGINGKTSLTTDIGYKNDSEFKGTGSSEKSHSLSGDITVVVQRVLANGNLVIQGSKTIQLAHSSEVVGIRGVIRESDISTVSNRIPSSKVADAYIYYKGAGASQSASERGFLTKMVQSKWWPL